MPFVLPGVVKIPAKNSFAEGAMLEPVNTVLKAVNRLNLLPGDTVLVAGQGPIGLMFTRLLQLRRHPRPRHRFAGIALETRQKIRREMDAVGFKFKAQGSRFKLSKPGSNTGNFEL